MFQPQTLGAREVRQQRRAQRGAKVLKSSPACMMPPSRRHADLKSVKVMADLDREARVGQAILNGSPKPTSSKERGMGKIMALMSMVTHDAE